MRLSVCECGEAETCAPIAESGYRYDSPFCMSRRSMGSVSSEHQICGEKQSIPRSKRLPPEEQLSSRMSGRASKIRCSTSYRPSIYLCAKAPLTPARWRFMSHFT